MQRRSFQISVWFTSLGSGMDSITNITQTYQIPKEIILSNRNKWLPASGALGDYKLTIGLGGGRHLITSVSNRAEKMTFFILQFNFFVVFVISSHFKSILNPPLARKLCN